MPDEHLAGPGPCLVTEAAIGAPVVRYLNWLR